MKESVYFHQQTISYRISWRGSLSESRAEESAGDEQASHDAHAPAPTSRGQNSPSEGRHERRVDDVKAEPGDLVGAPIADSSLTVCEVEL